MAPMLTQTTNFLTRQASVVMPKAIPPMQFNYPIPYGAIVREDGVQFVVFSKSATAMRVLL